MQQRQPIDEMVKKRKNVCHQSGQEWNQERLPYQVRVNNKSVYVPSARGKKESSSSRHLKITKRELHYTHKMICIHNFNLPHNGYQAHIDSQINYLQNVCVSG